MYWLFAGPCLGWFYKGSPCRASSYVTHAVILQAHHVPGFLHFCAQLTCMPCFPVLPLPPSPSQAQLEIQLQQIQQQLSEVISSTATAGKQVSSAQRCLKGGSSSLSSLFDLLRGAMAEVEKTQPDMEVGG